MNSRERVKLVLAHKQPDRVPMDLWGSACRVHTDLYKKIADYCGFLDYGERVRPGTTTEYVDYRLSDLVGVDFRHIQIGKPDNFQSYIDDKGRVVDEWGIGKVKVGNYMAIQHHPLSDRDINTLKRHKWPVPRDPGRIRGLGEQARDWHDNTDLAISATSAVSGIFFELAQYLCGADNILMAMYEDPYFVDALIDKLTEIIVDINLYYLEPIADHIEWIEFTEDFGMQANLLISPKMAKRFFRKPHQLLFGTIKKRFPNLKIFFHTCGVVEPLIPELVEWGIDILNPLQPLVQNMNMKRIKQEWGDHLIFHGAIDIQQAMRGSKQDVVNEVRERIELLSDGGGYILAPSNHLISDIPIDNFFTLYQYASILSREKYMQEQNI